MAIKTNIKSWRGRRFEACRATYRLIEVIQNLGVDDKTEALPPDMERLPKVADKMRLELENQAICLLRMILALNDQGCSPSKLNRF